MFRSIISAMAVLCSSVISQAATFTDQTAFLAGLDTFTLVDTSTHIGSTTLSIPIATGSFFGPDALVGSDDLILNGLGFHGSVTPHVGINFNGAVNAVGVTSNAIDGGNIQLFSGLNGTGTLLNATGFGGGPFDSFTGVIGSFTARSVIFTCEFNSDLRCGLRDPIFGFDNSAVAPVPLPAAGWLLVAALGGLGVLRLRREKV